MKKSTILFFLIFTKLSLGYAQSDSIQFENYVSYWKSQLDTLSFENCNECFKSANVEFQKEKDFSKRASQQVAWGKALFEKLKGKMIPQLTFETGSGKFIHTADLKGKVIVLNFWFIGCTPCVAELPGLNKLVNEYQNQAVIFIALGRDKWNEIENFLEKHPFLYHQIADAQKLITQFCMFGGYPINMIFDKEGKLVHISSGGKVEEKFQFEKYDKLKPVIDTYLVK